MSTIERQKKHTKLLSREEEVRIFTAYQQAVDKKEKDKLFSVILEHNIGLVVKAASHPKYKDSVSMDRDDFISEGIFGLKKAADKFNVGLGNKFSTYATLWVHQCMGRAKDDKDQIVRVPVYLKDRRNKYLKAKCEAIRMANDCSLDIISDFEDAFKSDQGLNEEQLAHLKKGSIASTFANLPTTEPYELEKLLGAVDSQESLDYFIDSEMLWTRLENLLTGKELQILKLRFLEGMTLQATGNFLGVTRERVRQLQEKALTKARRGLSLW